MNVSELKSSFFGNLINIPGWSSRRKIVVIESDDWGSIRMPSRTIYDNLKRHRIDVDTNPFNKYDNLGMDTFIIEYGIAANVLTK